MPLFLPSPLIINIWAITEVLLWIIFPPLTETSIIVPVYFPTCPLFIFNQPYFHVFHYFFRIEFEKTHVAVRTLKQIKIPLAQPLTQPKTTVGSGSNPIILNPSNLNFNNSSSSPPMVRNITAEETAVGTEISWEPPDEVSDIKERDIKRGPTVIGLSSRSVAQIFKDKTSKRLIYHIYPSKVVCLVQPGQDCWRSDWSNGKLYNLTVWNWITFWLIYQI